MRRVYKVFLKDSVIYSIPLFLAKAVGLILLPVYTRELGPNDYGFIELIVSSTVLVLLIIPLEINQAAARLLPESADLNRQKEIIYSSMWFTLITLSCFSIGIYFLRYELLALANVSEKYAVYAIYVALNIPSLAIVGLMQVQFRFLSLAKSSATINLIVVIANLVIVIFYTLFDTFGIKQYFLSQITSNLLGVFVGFLTLTRMYGNPAFKIDVSVTRELLRYSLPIVFSSAGVALALSMDRLAIGTYVGLTDLGHYGVGARFASIVAIAFFVISSAMTPIVYRDFRNNNTRKFIARLFHITIIMSIALLLLTIIYSKTMVRFIAGSEFELAHQYIFYMEMSVIFANLYIFFLGMDIEKKTHLIGKINLYTGIIGAIASFIFVQKFGVWGAIYSMMAANLMRISAYIYFSQQFYFVPVRLGWPVAMGVGLFVLNSWV